jgi:transposase
MPIVTAPALSLSGEQRDRLELMARSSSLPHRKVVQAKALLLAGDGVPNEEIARRCDTTPDTVRRWRAKFAASGVDGVGVIAPGRGRKPKVSAEVVEAIVHDTLHERPSDGSTHWTTRSMAVRHGVSKDMVARIWKARNLKPWQVTTFKLSNDPEFEAKLVDIVGLYLNPPERAVVLCVDEKTQTQALDRTQPSLPMKPGRAGTMTHDYKRNATTDLFAALNAATGEVLTDCRRRHTHDDFLAFLRLIDREVPRDLDVHLVLDSWCWTTCRCTSTPTSPSGSTSTSGSTCTSRRPRRRSSTSWSAGSKNSPTSGCDVACSPASKTSPTPSTCGSSTGTTTPNRSSGTRPPPRSSPRSSADKPRSTTSPNQRRTTSGPSLMRF